MSGGGMSCGRMYRARIFADADHLARELSACLRTLLAEPEEDACRPRALMLAGGKTPLAAYAALGQSLPATIPPWTFLYSDDRVVPPDDPRSNFGNTRPLLEALGATPTCVLRVDGEATVDAAAAAYDTALGRWLEGGGHIGFGLLGLGADGHTAGLFTPAHLDEARGRWAIGVRRPDGLSGVTVTPDLLRRVERLAFVITGADKREIARTFLSATRTTIAGRAVAGHPAVEVWLDAAAWPLN